MDLNASETWGEYKMATPRKRRSGNPDLWGLRAEGVASSSLLHMPGVLVWEDWGRVHRLTPLEGLRSLSQSQV